MAMRADRDLFEKQLRDKEKNETLVNEKLEMSEKRVEEMGRLTDDLQNRIEKLKAKIRHVKKVSNAWKCISQLLAIVVVFLVLVLLISKSDDGVRDMMKHSRMLN